LLKSTRTIQQFEARNDLTKKAANNLIQNRDRKKSKLIKNNELSTSFLDESRMKDHAMEKAKNDFKIRENRVNNIKHPKETRYEVLDYYEMNRKEVDKNSKLKPGELDKHFKDLKKLTPQLYKKKTEVSESKDNSLILSTTSKKLTKEELDISINRLAKPKTNKK
jgi:hypothetical protein